jgi:hypothetical protein
MMTVNASVAGGLRYKTCPDCGEMHDKYAWPANHRLPGEVLCAPSVVSDAQPAVRSMANGKIYDSKSEMRKHYKADGMVEVGNDPARKRPFKRAPTDRKAIRDALRKAEARVERGDVGPEKAHILNTRHTRHTPKIVRPDGPPPKSGTLLPSFK